jgi:enolase
MARLTRLVARPLPGEHTHGQDHDEVRDGGSERSAGRPARGASGCCGDLLSCSLMSEQDYDGWKKLTARFAEECKDMILIGDDLYTTNTELIKQGIEQKWASSLLLKVNQIGTISEAMDAARMIFQEKGNVAVSHRSGETPNTLIADLAVAIGAQFIKTGATARGERVAKYNRLLQIEEMLASKGWL